MELYNDNFLVKPWMWRDFNQKAMRQEDFGPRLNGVSVVLLEASGLAPFIPGLPGHGHDMSQRARERRYPPLSAV
jgi:hypothetical protein